MLAPIQHDISQFNQDRFRLLMAQEAVRGLQAYLTMVEAFGIRNGEYLQVRLIFARQVKQVQVLHDLLQMRDPMYHSLYQTVQKQIDRDEKAIECARYLLDYGYYGFEMVQRESFETLLNKMVVDVECNIEKRRQKQVRIFEAKDRV